MCTKICKGQEVVLSFEVKKSCWTWTEEDVSIPDSAYDMGDTIDELMTKLVHELKQGIDVDYDIYTDNKCGNMDVYFEAVKNMSAEDILCIASKIENDVSFRESATIEIDNSHPYYDKNYGNWDPGYSTKKVKAEIEVTIELIDVTVDNKKVIA